MGAGLFLSGKIYYETMSPKNKTNLAERDRFLLKNYLVDVPGQCLMEQSASSPSSIVLPKQMMDVLVYLSIHNRTPVSLENLQQQVLRDKQIDVAEIDRMLRQLAGHFGPAQQIIQRLDDNSVMLTADPQNEDGSTSISPPTENTVYHLSEFDRKKRLIIAMTLGFLVFVTAMAMIYVKPLKQSVKPTSAHSQYQTQPLLAVLPLENLSTEKNNDYLTTGISEVLAKSLSQRADVGIIARHSAFSFHGKYTNGVQIGAMLGASHVLKGIMTTEQNSITIKLGLLSTREDKVIWSDSYSERLNNLVTLQNRLTRDVAKAIAQLTGNQTLLADTINSDVDAFKLYLKALYYLNQNTLKANQKAQDLLQQAQPFAVRFKPITLTSIRALIQHYRLQQDKDPSLLEQAFAELNALGPQPDNATLFTLAGQLHQLSGDLDKAQGAFEQALKKHPNHGEALLYLGMQHHRQHRFNDAHRLLSKAERFDPRRLEVNHYLGRNLLYQGELNKGIEHLTKAVESIRDNADIEIEMAHWYRLFGDIDKTGQWAAVAKAKSPARGEALLAVAMGQKLPAEAKYWAQQAVQSGTLDNGFYHLAQLYYLNGDESSLAALIKDGDPALPSVRLWQGLWQMQQHQYQQACAALTPLPDTRPPTNWPLAMPLMLYNQLAYCAHGQGQFALKNQYLEQAKQVQYQLLQSGLRTPLFVTEMAAYLVLKGQPAKARQILKNAASKRWQLTQYLNNNPVFNLLKS